MSNTVPGIVLHVAKSESSDKETPLPAETTPVKTESVTKNYAKKTGNVETKMVDKKAEHVETNGNDMGYAMKHWKHLSACEDHMHIRLL